MSLPSEDFTVTARRRLVGRPVLVGCGWLTAAGGELLYCTLASVRSGGDLLAVDLTAVHKVDPAGRAWLDLARQECEAAGCELRILPIEPLREAVPPPLTPARAAGADQL